LTQNQIPLAIPQIGQEEKEAVLKVLESGWLAHGEYNQKLEEDFADFIGVKHAITMNSCTSALEVSLKVHGITGEVIIPSFSFVATANAVVNAGAKPVFCDVDIETRNVTAEHIESCITPNAEAVIVVHFGGQPCAMDDIVALCEKYGLLLIEDSAETIGATWKGKQAGSFGIGCFSFFPTKNMTTGEGGMVTCNDDSIAPKIRVLISHGISSTTFVREAAEKPWFRSAIMAGHNFRMSNILAAIGYYQFKKLDKMNHKRQLLANHYDKGIKHRNLPVKTPEVQERATHVYQMYTVQVMDHNKRDVWIHELRKNGVGASVHFDPPVHLQQFYQESYPVKRPLPNTEILAKSLITLPMYPDLSVQEVDHVLDVMEVVMVK
jgi:perosamine synthetase